jgi:hypothetical protein
MENPRNRGEAAESEASYEYSSSELSEDSSMDECGYEREYFGECSESSTEPEEEAAWHDEEEGERQLRRNYRSTAAWLDNRQSRKQLEVRKKRLSFHYRRSVLHTNYNIKLMKAHKEYLVAVDTANCVYIFKKTPKGLAEHNIFMIEKYSIADFAFVNDRILLASGKCGVLKELSFDVEVKDIRKRVSSNIRRLLCDGSVYVIGDELVALDTNYEILATFQHKVLDIAILSDVLYALAVDGQIFMLSRDLLVIKKISRPDRFDFRTIHAANGCILVGTGEKMQIYSRYMDLVRELQNLKEELTGCVEYEGLVVLGSSCPNSLKIIMPGNVCYDRFPFRTTPIAPITCMAQIAPNLILGCKRSISFLRLRYE